MSYAGPQVPPLLDLQRLRVWKPGATGYGQLTSTVGEIGFYEDRGHVEVFTALLHGGELRSSSVAGRASLATLLTGCAPQSGTATTRWPTPLASRTPWSCSPRRK